MPSSAAAARSNRAAPRDGETSAEAVARHVRKLIFDGRLKAGQRLPQDEIARAVGVSRIPVREAIISLEREGWLRVENHRGAFVYPLDEKAVADRFALYGRFYGFAARRAVERMTPDGGEALATLAAEVARAKSATAVERANARYLGKVVSIAASSRLSAVLRSMPPIVPGNFFAVVKPSAAIQKRGIAAMQAAIAAGDTGAAERASVDMQTEQAEAVIEMMTLRRQAQPADDS
jgi:DNA-binding GntR family transcriptional regulator